MSVFTFPDRADDRYALAMTDYCICIVLSAILTVAVLYGLYSIFFTKSTLREKLLKILACAALYVPVAVAVLAIKLPEGFLTNDEYAIYDDATHLIHDTWFNYMTVYYYIVSLILIPVRYGPIIMKVLIQLFAAGYCVYRAREYFGRRYGLLMYIVFLLYPVIAYTTSAHRLPVYFLVYLVIFAKLVFDRLEKRQLTKAGAAAYLVAGAVLTQWRTEGIYLLVIIPVLMFIAYPDIRNKKAATAVVVSYLIIQYVISVPQNLGVGSLESAANDRMKPFWAYTITNMYRNGLDQSANADDLAVIDRYIPIESIEAINDYYVENNYEDVLILTKEEFGGVREDAGYTQYFDFTQAVKRIIMREPGVFLRTRWGAFCFAALPYRIDFSSSPVSGIVSVVKSLSYNLFIPTVFVFVCAIVSLIRRRWFEFFLFAGLCAHWFIVFILAPASYFKYYFPVYIMAYFYAVMLLCGWLSQRRKKNDPVI